MYELGLVSILFFPVVLFISLGKFPKKIEIIFVIVVVLFASVVYSSRTYFLSPSDDMHQYYASYLLAGSYGFVEYLEVSYFEWLYTGWNWLLYQMFGEIDPRLYLFLTSLTFNICSACALFKMFEIQRYKLFIVFVILVMPNIGVMHTQLVRQTLSFSIFLLAISYPHKLFQILFFILATGLHKVSVIFFALLWSYNLFKKIIFRRYVLFIIPVVCLVLGLSLNMDSLISMLQSFPIIGGKANYLKFGYSEVLRIGILGSVAILLFLLSAVKIDKVLIMNSKKENKLYYVLFFILSGCLLFISTKALSERFFYLFLVFLPWYFVITLKAYVKPEQRTLLLAFFFCMMVAVFYRAVTAKYSGFNLFNGEMVNKELEAREYIH